jgi:energy-coupling factor transporter ATP-binding protein EcfA2
MTFDQSSAAGFASASAHHAIPEAIINQVELDAKQQQQSNLNSLIAKIVCVVPCAKDQHSGFVIPTNIGGRTETLPLDSLAAEDSIRATVKSISGRMPSKAQLDQIKAEIRIACRSSGKSVITYRRIGRFEGAYVIDIGDSNGTVAIIKGGRWELSAQSPCAFIRAAGYAALPMPIRAKSVRAALKHVMQLLKGLGIPGNRVPLVAIVLVCWLKEGVSYPLLAFYGPPGSGKSTMALILLYLVDPPSKHQLPNIKLSTEHLAAAAQAKHVLTFDNASRLSAELQDTLCVCSTGGEIYERQLYTNGEAAVLSIHRPVLITSVSPCVTRPDLMSRTIPVEFHPREERDDVESLLNAVDVESGELFGALLELVAASTVPVEGEDSQGHRLHDFCIAGQRVFAEAGVPPEQFMQYVDEMRASAGAEMAAGDSFVIALRKVLRDCIRGAKPGAHLPGWKKWFPQQVTSVIDEEKMCTTGIRPQRLLELMSAKRMYNASDEWLPKSTRELNGALLRVTPILNDIGIKARKCEPSSGNAYWEFVYPADQENGDA